ncbi:hypothetical protein BN12_220031 [Nostocoides japonicum T1-X7]|uniref:Uncharacterized protein n=1 Tax=Nostocoides japonicum T1-X7 TaxID=1194083 RepID=A0A077LV09_9MICO|nr:hypothetical protein [Tetrasphaera japonica]CCH77753.1 hypothetical protein BN12_220031 [Tetrasphaera japonica T1-X7]
MSKNHARKGSQPHGKPQVRVEAHKLWIHSDPGATTVWATEPDLNWVITEGFRRVRIPGVANESAGQVVVLVDVENGIHEVYTNHDWRLHDAGVTSEREVIDEAIRALQTVRAGIEQAETGTAGVTR